MDRSTQRRKEEEWQIEIKVILNKHNVNFLKSKSEPLLNSRASLLIKSEVSIDVGNLTRVLVGVCVRKRVWV